MSVIKLQLQSKIIHLLLLQRTNNIKPHVTINTKIQVTVKIIIFSHLENNPQQNIKFQCARPYQRATGGKDGFDGGAASSTAATAGGVNPLLFLPAIAEPNPNHLLFHVELISDHGDLFRGRFLVLLEEGKEARVALSALRRLIHSLPPHILYTLYIKLVKCSKLLPKMIDNSNDRCMAVCFKECNNLKTWQTITKHSARWFKTSEFLTSRKLFSKATRMLVSMLVLFFLLRLIPSMPMPGEPRALGLDRAWSDVRFSAQTAQTKRNRMEVKTMYYEDIHLQMFPTKWDKIRIPMQSDQEP